MGKYMKDALGFARQYPGWHSFAKDRTTRGAIKRLQKAGLVEVNKFGQFRARGAAGNPPTMEQLHDAEQKRLESFKGRCMRRNPRGRKKRKSKKFSWSCPRRSCKVRRRSKSSAKSGLGKYGALLGIGALAAAVYFGVLR